MPARAEQHNQTRMRRKGRDIESGVRITFGVPAPPAPAESAATPAPAPALALASSLPPPLPPLLPPLPLLGAWKGSRVRPRCGAAGLLLLLSPLASLPDGDAAIASSPSSSALSASALAFLPPFFLLGAGDIGTTAAAAAAAAAASDSGGATSRLRSTSIGSETLWHTRHRLLHSMRRRSASMSNQARSSAAASSREDTQSFARLTSFAGESARRSPGAWPC